jgi:endoglycosylceramidase
LHDDVRAPNRSSLWLAAIFGGCGGGAAGDGGGTSSSTEAASSGASSAASTDATSTAAPTTGEPEPLPGACVEPIAPMSRSSARLRVDPDGTLRDEHGRDVQLRGVNTGGRSKWAPYVPFPIAEDASLAEVQAAATAFFTPLREWGLDTVRVPFSWEGLEPVKGEFDDRYLDRYEAMIDAAWALQIRVIVDFHQDVYASPFCGDGFPLWTIAGEHGPPRRDCPNWGLGYLTDPDVRGAFDRFWADEDALQAAFKGMWTVMAERVGDHPGVLGLELLNEPGWGGANDIDAWKQATLMPFYTDVMAHLRAEVGDELLLVYDNTGIEAVGVNPTLHLRPEGEGLVYGPHIYDAGLIKGEAYTGSDPEAQIQSILAFSREAGVAALIGEFGYAHGAPGGDLWLARVVDELDATRVSATLWEYSRSAELWNEEDLSIVEPDGQARAILDVYVRPWLRAVAGDQASFRWDAAARTASAAWTGDGGVTELVLPPRLFPAGPEDLSLKTVSGPTGACLTHDPERGELRVQVPAGARVELRFTSPA